MLREVVHVPTREEVLTGEVRMPSGDSNRPTVIPTMFLALLEHGLQYGDMARGAVVLGRTQLAWGPDGMLEYACVSPVARGVAVRKGNVVEVEQRGTLATVVRVKYSNLAQGSCAYRTEVAGAAAISSTDAAPAGEKGTASLQCAGLVEEGWTRVPLRDGIVWTKAAPEPADGGKAARRTVSVTSFCYSFPR